MSYIKVELISISFPKKNCVGNSKGTVTKKKAAGYQKGITSFFCLETMHACALPHHLVTSYIELSGLRITLRSSCWENYHLSWKNMV